MPIEFSCPSCHQLVRTPAGTAGKKGKCPSCGGVVQIPLAVATASSTPSPQLTTPIHASPALRSTPPPHAVPAPFHESPNGTIEFYCQACGQLVRAPSRTAGKKGKCPNCQVVTQIPATSKTPSPAGKVEVGLDWLNEQTQRASRWRDAPRQMPAGAPNKRSTQDTVAELPELVPLIEPEPPPVGSLWDELTPADKNRPLTDHIPTLAELGPVPDPVFGIPLAPPGTSVVAATAVESGRRRFFSDANRRGLPWERDPSLDNFTQTVSYVCSAPQDAFQTMRRHDGIANPMCFLVVAAVLGVSLTLLEIFFSFAGWLYLQHGKNVDWEKFCIGFGLWALSQIVGATFGAAVGGFITAAIYHVGLLMLGAARCGFETTYRVMAFGLGSVYMLIPIPLVGPIFAVVMYFVILTYGFKQAHETTGGKAFLATILPHLVAFCLSIPLLLLLILPTMARMAH